jgi:DNA polymerase/3'-5' exonuclease PolX
MYEIQSKNIPQIQTERDIFDYLGLEYVEPKDRKGRGSVRRKASA